MSNHDAMRPIKWINEREDITVGIEAAWQGLDEIVITKKDEEELRLNTDQAREIGQILLKLADSIEKEFEKQE